MFHERINPDHKGARKMRDIIIFTDQPIRFEDCRAEISNNIKDVETNKKTLSGLQINIIGILVSTTMVFSTVPVMRNT